MYLLSQNIVFFTKFQILKKFKYFQIKRSVHQKEKNETRNHYINDQSDQVISMLQVFTTL